MTPQVHRQVPRIDLWILGTMRQRAEIVRRFALGALQQEAVEDTVRAARSAGIHQPGTLTNFAVREFFGPPGSASDGRLTYDLQLWPEHVYEWIEDTAGRIMHSAFQIRDSARAYRALKRGAGTHERFEPWLDTESEVRRVLGEPTSEEGWWPEHDLHYRPAESGDDLVFTFDHGLLTAVTPMKQAPAEFGL